MTIEQTTIGVGKNKTLITFLPLLFFLALPPRSIKAQDTKNDWVTSHNHYRTIHATQGLTWSKSLAKSARKWAQRCSPSHSRGDYGENIFKANYSMSPREVVHFWYLEEKKYNYKQPGFSIATGHFSQLIWKSTAEIGCGYTANCPGRMKHVWVCQYYPPGNYRKQFRKNVLPPVPPEIYPSHDVSSTGFWEVYRYP